jgi:membrane protein DedA with SNARE-associated domain
VTDFWMTFLGGLASGVVLTVLGYFVRRLFQRRSRGEPMIELSMEKLRPFIPILVGAILLLLGLFGGKQVESSSDYLVATGAMLMFMGSIWASFSTS